MPIVWLCIHEWVSLWSFRTTKSLRVRAGSISRALNGVRWGRALRESLSELNVCSQNLRTQASRLQSQNYHRHAELPAFKTLLPNSLPRVVCKARLRPRSELNPVTALRHLTSGRHLTAQNEISHYSRKECLASRLILDNNTKGGG